MTFHVTVRETIQQLNPVSAIPARLDLIPAADARESFDFPFVVFAFAL
jgi:hypothetical protein